MMISLGPALVAKLPKIGGRELRHLPSLEVRQTEGTLSIGGYAAIWDIPYPLLGDIWEVVRRGAFTTTLQQHDQRLLVQHEGLAVARRSRGTLRLVEDEIGLRVDADLDLSSPLVQTVASALRRGDVDGMSIGFTTVSDLWTTTQTGELRELLEVDLWEVSIVTFPAQEATLVGLRSDSQLVCALTDQLVKGTISSERALRIVETLSQKVHKNLGQKLHTIAGESATISGRWNEESSTSLESESSSSSSFDDSSSSGLPTFSTESDQEPSEETS